jgi:hypothetical protein
MSITFRGQTAFPRDNRAKGVRVQSGAIAIPAGAVEFGMRILLDPAMLNSGGFGAKYGHLHSLDNGSTWKISGNAGLPPGSIGTVGNAAGMDPGLIPSDLATMYDFVEPDEGSSGTESSIPAGATHAAVFIEPLGGNNGGPVEIGAIVFFRDANGASIDF